MKTERQQRAEELAKEFPKLAIGESGTFCRLTFKRVSAKMYVMENQPTTESRNHGLIGLRMSKADLVAWFNTAPIQLGKLTGTPDPRAIAFADTAVAAGVAFDTDPNPKGKTITNRPERQSIQQRFLSLPGATKRRIPREAHDSQDLEDSVAARVRRWFALRGDLQTTLREWWQPEEIKRAELDCPRNPRQVLAELEKATCLGDGWPDDLDFSEISALITELSNILEPLLSQLPEP